MTDTTWTLEWDEEHGVVRTDWLPGSVCDLEQATAVTGRMSELEMGPAPVLVDMRGMASFERAAREHFVSDQGRATAIALLAESAVTKMMANFFIGMRRMPVPIRMFTEESEAMAWLQEHR